MNKAIVIGLLLGTSISSNALYATEAPKVEPTQALAQSPHISKISINTATAAELQLLKGIGEAKAKAIVQYREQYGRFASVEDLTKVSGVGQKVLDDNRDLLSL
ncbi:ComEA family DNA-binding protein [Shewanella sp.]|uniref:ComEA family DNA-binding protein n=1 Tax=Shewanella sp. TaxID=50422 RepID=UPI00356B5967